MKQKDTVTHNNRVNYIGKDTHATPMNHMKKDTHREIICLTWQVIHKILTNLQK